MKQPRHVAIIMDGNGRWAKARRHSRIYGHIRGAKIAKQIIEESARLRIDHLTLFAFSTENWFRPMQEVTFLMQLLRRQLLRETETLMRNNIQFRVIGDVERMPAAVQQVVRETIAMTAHNTGMVLTFALSYGGRQEITEMAKEIARRSALGELGAEEIDEALIASMLPSSFLPDPDLVIRTSGERRISNFFLWQAAYSEIEFESMPWPEFTIAEYRRVLESFGSRERRFGRTSEQVRSAEHG
jgi:undecaprenyl diphosphate synthase